MDLVPILNAFELFLPTRWQPCREALKLIHVLVLENAEREQIELTPPTSLQKEVRHRIPEASK
jgi:hypothetical protein